MQWGSPELRLRRWGSCPGPATRGRLLLWASHSPSLLFGILLFSCSVVPDSLRPRGLQHAGLPCPSPSPRARDTEIMRHWDNEFETLLKLMSTESVMPANHPILCRLLLSSCLHSFPTSGSLPMSRLFALGGQSIRASAAASVLPMNIQGFLVAPNWEAEPRALWGNLVQHSHLEMMGTLST